MQSNVEEEALDNVGEKGRGKFLQELWFVSKSGDLQWNWGWESKRNEEKCEEEEEDEVNFETKEGEKIRVLKCLQVDVRLKKVFNGKNDRTCSRTSSGNLLQILGSIFLEIFKFFFCLGFLHEYQVFDPQCRVYIDKMY